MIKSVFKTMGYKNVKWISFTSVKRVKHEKRVTWLADIEDRFAKVAEISDEPQSPFDAFLNIWAWLFVSTLVC